MGQALRMLNRREDTRVLSVSPVYRTPPWGKTDQNWFSNAVAMVETSLAPEQLLEASLTIEKRMKRVRMVRWGPRIIDIDILAYEGAETFSTVALTIPHPRMTERGFVLIPLADIAPDLVVNGRSVAAWRDDCDQTGIEKAGYETGWWRRKTPLVVDP
ncbi:MAG: 2-amino-4-hydroxy-6-hydroxymethyldihydropteridine diphosphokinase [Phyllobacterium sp.]